MRLAGEKYTLGTGKIPLNADLEDFVINNLGLANNNYKVTSFSKTPLSEISKFNNPLSNGRGFVAQYMRGGTISMNLIVKGENKEDFMQKIDSLYKEIYSEDPILRFKINGLFRKTKVRCTSSPINFLHYNTYFINLVLNFEYYDFLETENGQSFSFVNKSGNFGKEITNIGNAESEFDFYFVFKENTNLTKIKIENDNNFIEIEESFTAGDILYINSEKKEVYKNNEIIDYEGIILNFKINVNFLNFIFEGDILCDIFVLAPKKYI